MQCRYSEAYHKCAVPCKLNPDKMNSANFIYLYCDTEYIMELLVQTPGFLVQILISLPLRLVRQLSDDL